MNFLAKLKSNNREDIKWQMLVAIIPCFFSYIFYTNTALVIEFFGISQSGSISEWMSASGLGFFSFLISLINTVGIIALAAPICSLYIPACEKLNKPIALIPALVSLLLQLIFIIAFMVDNADATAFGASYSFATWMAFIFIALSAVWLVIVGMKMKKAVPAKAAANAGTDTGASTTAFCSKCGQKADLADSAFCKNCGAPLK